MLNPEYYAAEYFFQKYNFFATELFINKPKVDSDREFSLHVNLNNSEF